MNESPETTDRLYRRWGNMTKWFEEASTIIERVRSAGAPQIIPMPGKWALQLSIPARGRVDGDYSDAMEAGMALVASIRRRPEDAYLEHGFCVICLRSEEFYRAKTLAEKIRRWLIETGYNTVVEDSYRNVPWKPDAPAHIRFFQDQSAVLAPGDWQLRVMIPKDGTKDALRVSQVGAELEQALELTTTEKGLRVGGWLLTFSVGDFTVAKAKAKQTISWSTDKGYKQATSWGDSALSLDPLDEETVRALNETGGSFYPFDHSFVRVELAVGNHIEKRDCIRERRKRLLARLAGPADAVSVALTRAEIRVLLDLAAECEREYRFFAESIDADAQSYYRISDEDWKRYREIETLLPALAEMLEKLRAGLS